MKQGKRPTRNQKKVIIFTGLNPKNWLVYKKKDDELHIVHRETGTVKKIPAQ